MKRLILLMMVGLAGCECPENEKPAPPSMGTYSTNTALITRKYDLFSDNHHNRKLDIEIKRVIYPCEIPGKLDESWWANVVEGRVYRVTTEVKDGKRYVWKCERID